MILASRFGIFLLFFFLILNIPVMEIKGIPYFSPVYEYSMASGSTVRTTLEIAGSDFVFHRPVSGSYYSSHQYEINRLDKKGSSILSFIVPQKKDVLKDKSTAALEGKDGFLTYPSDGSFYLWYPKLGNSTFFYDQSGEFLWSHRSSHYLRAFPAGEFILAMTGDHSRAFFLLPDLSQIGSTEGTLLINYEFSNSGGADSPMICLGYLDGDIVFFYPRAKKEIRISAGGTTKSISCNFQGPAVAAHMESGSQQDVIRIGVIDDTAKVPGVRWGESIQLPGRYNQTIPVGLGRDFLVALLPNGKNISLLATDRAGAPLFTEDIGASDVPIDDWRIINMDRGIVAWNSTNLYFLTPGVSYRQNLSVENVTSVGNQIFIQTKDRIISYLVTGVEADKKS